MRRRGRRGRWGASCLLHPDDEGISDSRAVFVAILGPRQCGKSTLARMIISNDENFVYLDLEKYSDLNKLNELGYEWIENRNQVTGY